MLDKVCLFEDSYPNKYYINRIRFSFFAVSSGLDLCTPLWFMNILFLRVLRYCRRFSIVDSTPSLDILLHKALLWIATTCWSFGLPIEMILWICISSGGQPFIFACGLMLYLPKTHIFQLPYYLIRGEVQRFLRGRWKFAWLLCSYYSRWLCILWLDICCEIDQLSKGVWEFGFEVFALFHFGEMALKGCEDCMELGLVCVFVGIEFDDSALEDGDEI